jgi:hypothetical protein
MASPSFSGILLVTVETNEVANRKTIPCERCIAEYERREDMYYRVAIKADSPSPWQWKSTVLSSLDAVFQWLRLYRALPYDRLHIFSSSSREMMNEQPVREGLELESDSVPALQFLHERMMYSSEAPGEASAGERRKNERIAPIAVSIGSSSNESSWGAFVLDQSGVNFLEKRRIELEQGAGGDHDQPYQFRLPSSLPQALAWTKLLVRVQQGEIQP